MSKTIDERVVEMRFDNEDFEENAKESLGTLDKLKQALHFDTSTSEIDKLGRAVNDVDMSGLGGAVEAVKNKFSALEVIAVTALMNITNKALNAGESLVRSLTIDQIGSGWDKYAQKTTAVQTIMAATANQFTDTAEQMDYVNAQLDKLNAFTDETSYNFVDMVGNIGKFTSNNIKLETAVTSMQGIAAWAAISGQNAGTASRAMYQLSQAMGGGVIRLQDWMSIETANMATAEFKQTAMDTAVSLGKLNKSADGTYTTLEGNIVTIENFRSTLQDLWFTSDVLTESLEKYGKFSDVVLDISDATGITVTDLITMTGEFKDGTIDLNHWMDETGKSAEELTGYLNTLGADELDLGFRAMRAAQEAKTLEEAIGSVKDAVSTGWMKTFEIIFGDYEQAKKLFTGLANELYDVFAESGNARNELLEEAFSQNESGWDKLKKSVQQCGGSVENFQDILVKTAREHGIQIDNMIKEEGSFEKTLSRGWLNGDILRESLGTFTSGLDHIADATNEAQAKLDSLGDVAKRVISGEFGEGEEVMRRLTDAGYDYTTVQAAVNKILEGEELSFGDLSKAQLRELGVTEDQIEAFKMLSSTSSSTDKQIQALINTMQNGNLSGRSLLFESISNTWEAIKRLIGAVHDAWEEVFPPTTADQIYNSLQAVNNFSKSLLEFAEKVAPSVQKVFKSVFLVFSTFREILGQVAEFISGVFRDVLAQLDFKMEDFGDSLVDVVKRFRDWVREAKPVTKFLTAIYDKVKLVVGWLVTMVNKIATFPVVTKLITAVQDAFGYLFDKVSTGVPGFLTILEDVGSYISGSFPNFSKAVGDLVSSFKDMDKLSFDSVISSLSTFKDNIIDLFFNGIGQGNIFKNTINKIKSSAKDALDKVSDSLSKINAGTVLSVGLATSLIGAVLRFRDLAKVLKKPADLITGVINSIKGAFSGISRLIKAAALVPIAIAIGILAASLYALSKIPIPNLIAATFAIGVLGGALVGLGFALSKIGNIGKLSLSFTQIAIAAAAIAGAIWLLGKVTIDEKIGWKLAILAGVIVVLTVVSIVLSKFAKDASGLAGAFTMLGFALSVMLLVNALTTIADEIANGKAILDATTSLGQIIIAFGAVMVLIAKFGGENLKGGAMSMIGMALALKLVVWALESVANFDAKMIYKNIWGYVTIFGALITLAVVARIAGTKIGFGMVGLIAGVVLMALAFKMVNALKLQLTLKQIFALIAVIGGIVVLFGAVSNLMGTAQQTNFAQVGLMLLEFSAAIVILIAAIALVGLMPLGVVIQGGLVVAALMILMKRLVEVSYAAKGLKGELIALAVIFGILVAGVAVLAYADTGSVVVATLCVAALMIMLGILIKAISQAKIAWQGLAMLAAVLVLVGGLVALMAAFTDVEKVSAIASSLAQLFGALALMMISISIAGALGAVAMVGLGIMLGVMAIVAIVLAVIYFTNTDMDALVEYINKAIPLFEKFGELTASVFSGMIQKLSDTVLQSMLNLAEGLGKFSEKIKAFFDSVKEVTPEQLQALSALLTAIGSLTATSFLQGIVDFVTRGDSLTQFGNKLPPFGEKLKEFLGYLNGVEAAPVDAAAHAITAISAVAQDFQDNGGLEVLGNALGAFGPQFKTFYDSIKEVDPEQVDAIAESLTTFSESIKDIQTSVAPSGGTMENLKQMIFGDGVEIPFFLGEGVEAGSFNAEEMIQQFMSGTGQQITDYAPILNGQASATGEGLVYAMAGAINGNIPEIDASTFNLNETLAQNLPPEYAAIIGEAYGSSATEGVATGVNENAHKVVDAYGNVVRVTSDTLDASSETLLAQGRAQGDAYVQGVSAKTDMATAAGKALADAVTNGIDDKILNFTTRGQALADAFVDEIGNHSEDAKSAGKTIALDVAAGMSSTSDSFTTAGSQAAAGFISGVNSQLPNASSAGSSLGQALLNAARAALDEHSPSRAMYEVGDLAGIGFVNALINRAKDAYKAGSEFGDSSVDGIANSIASMRRLISDMISTDPVITPTLDLSNVRLASDQIASMLNGSIGLTVPAASTLATPVRYGGRYNYAPEIQNRVNPEDPNAVRTEINNTFYVQSHDPEGVANETSRIIQHQVGRRYAAIGRVGV